MSTIDIVRHHNLSKKTIETIVAGLADQLATKYGATYEYVDDGVAFKGAGVEGILKMLDDRIHITANLGFLMSAFKGTLEKEINAEVDRLIEQQAQKAEALEQAKPQKTKVSTSVSKTPTKKTTPTKKADKNVGVKNKSKEAS